MNRSPTRIISAMGTSTAAARPPRLQNPRVPLMIPVLIAIVSACGASAGCAPPTAENPASTSASLLTDTASVAQQCDSIRSAQLETVMVTLVRGDTDCRQARDIATEYVEAMAAFQGHNSGYALVDGWTCNSAIASSPIPDQPFWTCTTQDELFTIGPPNA